LRTVASARHLDNIVIVDLDVVVEKNQHEGFLLELEVNAPAKVLVNDEDSFGLLCSLVCVVEQLIFFVELLSGKFHFCCSLSDLPNQAFVPLLKEDKNWIFHLSFEDTQK